MRVLFLSLGYFIPRRQDAVWRTWMKCFCTRNLGLRGRGARGPGGRRSIRNRLMSWRRRSRYMRLMRRENRSQGGELTRSRLHDPACRTLRFARCFGSGNRWMEDEYHLPYAKTLHLVWSKEPSRHHFLYYNGSHITLYVALVSRLELQGLQRSHWSCAEAESKSPVMH